MINNKKGITQWLFVGIAAVLLLGFILFSKGTFAIPSLHSLTPKSAGYTQERCPDIGVVVSGNVNIEDSAVFDLEPSIKGVDVTEIKVNGRDLLAFGTETFTYKVKGTDTISGSSDTFSGSGELKSGDNQGISKQYSLSYTIPDFNCDRRIDDFNLEIHAELKGEDIGEVKQYDKLIRIRGGDVQ